MNYRSIARSNPSLSKSLLSCTSLFLWLIFSSSPSFGQGVIQELNFNGLKKTKASHLQYFIDSKTGTEFNPQQIDKDIQRLKNLYAVANAMYQVDTLEKGLKLTFEIEEALTLFPIINFGGVKGNFWYQVGFTDINWLGRGKQLTMYYQDNDRRSNFNIYYRDPFLNGSKWGYSFGAFRFASIEPLFFGNEVVFYDYTNLSIGATGIYNINRQQYFELGLTYFIEDYEKNARHREEMTPGPEALREPKALLKLFHQINRIDYHFFYREGIQNTANFQSVYSFVDYSYFNIFINDFRYYKRVKEKGNFAMRFRLGIATNRNSPFAPFVVDSYVNIRGSGNRIDRGTGQLTLNFEYLHTVYERPKVAAQIVGFSDIGTWRNPGGTFADLWDPDNFRHFAGGGVRLIYKKAYNAILRIDYGIDIYNTQQRGFVLGLGQYF
ncbi:MAG: POTRA domain-containing protein [Bacteroidota bacterium]